MYNHRPCTKPDEIARYLKENTGFEGNIEASDRVCYTCYESHNITLQKSKSESSNRDLKEFIAMYVEVPCMDDITTIEGVINTTTTKTVVSVGRMLLKEQARA